VTVFGSGMFRIPLLFSGLRRFVDLVRRAAAGRRRVSTYYVDELGNQAATKLTTLCDDRRAVHVEI